MQDNELVERCLRAILDDFPMRAISPALAEKTGVSLGEIIPFDTLVEAGWDHGGYERTIRAIIPIVRAEILQGLADAAASWGSKTAEEIATAIRNQEPTDG